MHHFISFILRIGYAAAFGFILTFHPEDIVYYIPQLLGGMLMLEAVGQLLELLLLKFKTRVGAGFFVIPILVLIFALILMFENKLVFEPGTTLREVFDPQNGISNLAMEMMAVGFCLLLFILTEVIISIVFFKPLYMPKKFAEEKAKREAELQAAEKKAAAEASDKSEVQ